MTEATATRNTQGPQATTGSTMPLRLHHNAYVTNDLEKTRWFYEDVVGMPLIATWCEKANLFGKERTYCHCFFGMEDESALAFFQFADPEDQKEFGPELPVSGFRHIALLVDEDFQQRVRAKLEEIGYDAQKWYHLDHGYCHSLYVFDPNDMIVEFTVDHPEVERINREIKPKAHSELKRWLAGDHTPNNTAFERHQ